MYVLVKSFCWCRHFVSKRVLYPCEYECASVHIYLLLPTTRVPRKESLITRLGQIYILPSSTVKRQQTCDHVDIHSDHTAAILSLSRERKSYQQVVENRNETDKGYWWLQFVHEWGWSLRPNYWKTHSFEETYEMVEGLFHPHGLDIADAHSCILF